MSAVLDVATRPCTLQELLAALNAAEIAQNKGDAESLIEAIYARLDAAAITNTSDGATA